MNRDKPVIIGENERTDIACVYEYDNGISYQIGDGRNIRILECEGAYTGEKATRIQFHHNGKEREDYLNIECRNGQEIVSLQIKNDAMMILWLLIQRFEQRERFSFEDMDPQVIPDTIDRRTEKSA